MSTDHEGYLKTRKLTSGDGSHLIKSWSGTQPTITLSSGEAEFRGVVKGAAIGLGFCALPKDVGVELGLSLGGQQYIHARAFAPRTR